MMCHPAGETREQREVLTKRALADIVRSRVDAGRLRPTDIAQKSGMSGSFLRALRRAEKGISLFVFLELCSGLSVDDACELLREVLNRRDALSRLEHSDSS